MNLYPVERVPTDRVCASLPLLLISLALLMLLAGCGGGGNGGKPPPPTGPEPPASPQPSTLEQAFSIQGDGDIVSESAQRDCVLEDQPCSIVITEDDDYRETYRAVAREGWSFSHWEGCASPPASADGATCSYALTAEDIAAYPDERLPTLLAHFEPIARTMVLHTLALVGQGDIVSTSANRDCAWEEQPCTQEIVRAEGYSASYQAAARDGWRFIGWSDCLPDGVENGAQCTYSLSAQELDALPDAAALQTLTATFEPLPLAEGDTFFDDFATDSLDQYLIHNDSASLDGQIAWDAGKVAITTGDGASIALSTQVPASTDGLLNLDLVSSRKHNGNGVMSIRLKQDDQNYYELINADSSGSRKLRKVVDGVEVGSVNLLDHYEQSTRYNINLFFSPNRATAGGYAHLRNENGRRTVVSLTDGSEAAIEVNTLTVYLHQQDADLDNLFYTSADMRYLIGMGDSITFGKRDDRALDGIGYPPLLKDAIFQARGEVTAVFNEGWSGEKASQAASRFPAILTKHPAATGVLLFYGTNDSRTLIDGAPVDPVSPSSFGASLQQMIDAAKRRNLTVYIAKPLKTAVGEPQWNHDAQAAYGTVVEELIQTNELGTLPPDFYCYFDSHPDQLPDGRHPNNDGYRAIAGLWRNAVLASGGLCTP